MYTVNYDEKIYRVKMIYHNDSKKSPRVGPDYVSRLGHACKIHLLEVGRPAVVLYEDNYEKIGFITSIVKGFDTSLNGIVITTENSIFELEAIC